MRRRPVADQRALAAGQQGGELLGVRRERRVPDEVDAAVHPMQLTRSARAA
jgi:hypothetical protein